jgi:hypothetical protein
MPVGPILQDFTGCQFLINWFQDRSSPEPPAAGQDEVGRQDEAAASRSAGLIMTPQQTDRSIDRR